MSFSENIGAPSWTGARPERNPADFGPAGLPGFVRVPVELLGQFAVGLPTPLEVATGMGSMLQQAIKVAGSPEAMRMADGVVRMVPKLVQLAGGLVAASGAIAGAVSPLVAGVPYVGAAVEIYAPLATIGGGVVGAAATGADAVMKFAPPQQVMQALPAVVNEAGEAVAVLPPVGPVSV